MLGLLDDLRSMMLDDPSTVVIGGMVGRGLLGYATEEDALNGEAVVAGKTRALWLIPADFGGAPRINSTLSVEGVDFKANRVLLKDDGRVAIVYLGAL